MLTGPVRVGVAAALLGSAVVHATVVGEHLEEWAPAGTFFLGLVLLETVLAVVALRTWNRAVALTVVVSGVATVALWTLSRTHGLPVGPADFRVPEGVGVPDLSCCALELLAAALAGASLLRGRTSLPTLASRIATAAVVALAVGTTGWGLGPTLAASPGQTAHHAAAHG